MAPPSPAAADRPGDAGGSPVVPGGANADHPEHGQRRGGTGAATGTPTDAADPGGPAADGGDPGGMVGEVVAGDAGATGGAPARDPADTADVGATGGAAADAADHGGPTDPADTDTADGGEATDGGATAGGAGDDAGGAGGAGSGGGLHGRAEQRGVPRWLLAPLSATSWLYTLYVVLGLVVGAVYFAVVTPLIVLAVVTTPFLFLGTPLLWLSMGLARAFGNLERARLRGFTGVAVPPSPLEGRRGVLRSMFWLLRSKDRWREVAYCALRLPLSALSAALVVGSWVGGVVLAVNAPIIFFDRWNFLEAAAAGFVGVALFVTAPWLARGAVVVDTALVRLLLGPSEKERLTEEVSTLRTSRAGVVDAADAERRRIERDLHDGAQQRLVALAMDLGVARARYDDDPRATRDLIVKAHEEAKAALADLRELVRGIHPAVLTDRGLDAALSALAARCAVPVEVEVDVDVRADVTVEAAAYFVVAEALTNISRHSGADQATVTVTRVDEMLRVSVQDDGVGGADTTTGTGLAGLERRVAALDGTFQLTSPHGGPTTIVAELPCGS